MDNINSTKTEPKGYSLIVSIVNRGYSNELMEAARAAGARGGTVIHARATGVIEVERLLGIDIQPEKDIVLILTDDSLRQAIMKSIYKQVGLETDASGFSFSLPVEDIIGTVALTKSLVAEPK